MVRFTFLLQRVRFGTSSTAALAAASEGESCFGAKIIPNWHGNGTTLGRPVPETESAT